MEQLNVVIAELQLALVFLDSKNPDKVRLKATLDQAFADLRTAVKAITGQDPLGGET